MVAGPETSILDIMSSPDPLNESDATHTQLLISSARRITRSQSTQRLYALESSPKKQTFALDVGNEISPQKILVTVETEDAAQVGSRTVNRRLFQSPTPKRAIRRRTPKASTTTTTVPLRGLTDDEADGVRDGATPKARGRPRKPGTPAVTRRKRAGTPLSQKAPTQSRATRSSSVLTSDISADDQATPRASQAKRAPKRKASSPAKDDDSISGSQPRKRGRPRRKPDVPSDLPVLPEQESGADGEVEDNAVAAPADDNVSVADSRAQDDPATGDMEEDIWLANLSDHATPVARRSTRTSESESVALLEPSPERQRSEAAQSEVDFVVGGEYGDFGGMGSQSDAESVAGDTQDAHDRQDTVMAGEEFTMISINTLPSMQPNSSMMAAEQLELGEETSLIINGALESLRQSQQGRDRENATADEPPVNTDAIRSAAGDALTQQLATRLSSQQSSPQSSRSPRRIAKAQPLSRQLALKSLQGAAPGSPERPPALSNPESQPHDTSTYDDSFSEIPEEILTAATPRRLRHVEAEPEEDAPIPDIQPSIERPSTVNHSNPQSESNRLLTPDETPSPAESEDENSGKQDEPPRAAPDTEMPSSPPVPSAVAQRQVIDSTAEQSRAHSNETPAEQLSDYNSPAMAALNEGLTKLPPPETHNRPTLSPIVRAGRALQLVTSDPPSPPGRDSVLRSPFRRSVPRSSHSPAPPSVPQQPQATQSPPPVQSDAAARPSQRSWFEPLNQIKNFVVQGAQALSPRVASVSGMDDPFAPNPGDSPRPASVRGFLLGLGSRQSTAQDLPAPATESARAIPLDDEDAMSWQSEGSPIETGLRERSDSHTSSVHAAHGSPVSKDADLDINEVQSLREEEYSGESMDQDDRGGQEAAESRESEDQDNDVGDEDEYEDDDIWAIEAQRPAPAASTAASSRREQVVEPPRRSKIPSPWRQNSRRLVYSDELHKLAEDPGPQSEADEFSMVAQHNDKGHAPPQPPVPKKVVDLSEFFSSPAAVPGSQASGFGLFRALDAPRMEKPTGQESRLRQAPARPGSPRKQGFGSGLDARSSSRVSQHEQQMPSAGFQRGRQLFDTSRDRMAESAPRTDDGEPQHTPSPPATDSARFGHVPQKSNFTPRPRQASNTLFQPGARSLFGTTQGPLFSAVVADDEGEIPATSSPDSSFLKPDLKPLPNRAMSPSKSCIRSPLKAKTPGRVVEFTSSTLSPLAQVQARAERRASASPEKQLSPASSSRSSSVSEEDKENQDSVSEDEVEPARVGQEPQHPPVLAPPSLNRPLQRPSSPTKIQKLSPTQWSRDHWVRLGELLQARRQGMLQFQLQLSRAPYSAGRKGNPASQRLLGKKATAQGESMTLEQWHLDIVDAFKAEVGGWDEGALARRLFALMVGEERRLKGLVPPRS